MALSANTVFEIRTGGADTNGAGFVTGASGTDHSLQDAAQYSVTDAVTAGTTTITSVTANFGTDVVGNILYIEGGTGAIVAAWYEIISRTNSTTIVVDRSTGLSVGTGATLKIGGALASPGGLGAALASASTSGMKAWIKSGTYTLTSSTANVAGGKFSGPSNKPIRIEGYTTTRGDGGVPIISCGAIGTITVFTVAIAGDIQTVASLRYLKVDANGQSSITAFAVSGQTTRIEDCYALSCSTGFLITSNADIVRSFAESCTTGISVNSANAFMCRTKSCTTGFSQLTTGVVAHCLATGGTTGFSSNSNSYCRAINCVAYGASGSGYATWYMGWATNCYAENCGAYGFNMPRSSIQNCGGYNNTSGNVNASNVVYNDGFVTLSGSAFVDAAGDDFRPNATASAGALLRAAGIGVYGQTDNRDIGAVQHADPVGATGFVVRRRKRYIPDQEHFY